MPNTPALKLLMISSEVARLARTGGLGDVVDSLSLTLAELGHHVLVVTPRYGVTKMPAQWERWKSSVSCPVGWLASDVRDVGVIELAPKETRAGGTLRVCLVDDPALFQRDGIYGDKFGSFGDNDLRFATLSRAALEIGARAWGSPTHAGPDVVSAHDWHAAFAVVYQKSSLGELYADTPSVLTIHNLAYQGVFEEEMLDRLGIPHSLYTPHVLAHEGHVNLLKGGTALADAITTVSPRYAFEITTKEGGFGLDAHLTAHREKLVGITNGIDTTSFDPGADGALDCMYDARNVNDGKSREKAKIQGEFALDPSPTAPLFVTVSRFVHQKGIDLFASCVPELVARGGQVVLVGQGDRDVENLARDLASRFPGRVGVRIAFDEALARRLYAASDFFAVPSRFEPCGLTQLYAMRYGSLPVVTSVGGLFDTVQDVDDNGTHGTGIVAPLAAHDSLSHAFSRAIALYQNRDAMNRVIQRAMARDSSWEKSAHAYESLFARLAAANAVSAV